MQLRWSSSTGSPAVAMSQAQRSTSQLHLPGEISRSVFEAGRLDLRQLKPREAITAFQTRESNLKEKLYKLSVFLESRLENG